MKLLSIGLMAACLPAMAFNINHTFSVSEPTVASDAMHGHGAVSKQMSISRKAPAKRSSWAFGKDIVYYEQYGTLKEILSEDFSKLTMGTEELPDLKTKLTIAEDSPEFTYPWWNFKPEYTHEPNWGVGCAYGAGGTLYWRLDADTPQAHFNTCLVDVSKGDGVFIIEFKARASENSDQGYVQVEAGETHNMGPSWDTCDDPIVIQVTDTEWTTYRVMFRGGGPTTLINVVGMLYSDNPYERPTDIQEIWLDDVKVYQLETFVGLPTTLPVTDYKGTSFTANWNTVAGAEKYLLSVYSHDEEGAKKFLLEDQEVTGTSYNVTNAVSGETYYYEVKSVGNGHTSLSSFPERVYMLETPVLNQASKTGDYEYKATWNDVPGASVYNYTAYDKRVAKEDGPFVVTNEDFTGILDADGYPTGWTKEDPEGLSYDQFYCNELKQQRWEVQHGAPYDGYMALDAFWYESGQGQAAFISPEFDMSKDGGKFILSADLAGDVWNTWDENEKPITLITQCCVALFNWNDEKGDYDQVELIYPEDEITNDWEHHEFTFTKGSTRSKVGIFAIGSYLNLYIDNLLITQNYKKDEYLMEPYLYRRYHGSKEGEVPTEITVSVPAYASGYELYHSVSAFGRQADAYGQSYDDRESPESALEYVMSTTVGIDDVVALGAAQIVKKGNVITVTNPNAEAIRIVTADGKTVAASSEEEFTYTLTDGGVYVIAVGKKALKAVL
ncbi:MAG: fibronectin type III domain-containing protein [Prevotella sp.]|nr:fibronectin type III domain-containing protein [Prevotella sp.]MCM1074861.1 fibronectin type III domain-containing protein [Ruminococcus sp.]